VEGRLSTNNKAPDQNAPNQDAEQETLQDIFRNKLLMSDSMDCMVISFSSEGESHNIDNSDHQNRSDSNESLQENMRLRLFL